MSRKLTLREAAEFLRFSPKTLYSWTSQRKIPHLKVQGRLLFDEGELERWLERFSVVAEDPAALAREGMRCMGIRRNM